MGKKYNLLYSDIILKQLKKMDKHEAKKVMTYLEELSELEDVKTKGKPLEQNLSGLWRYRIQDYRVVCEIFDNKLSILALYMGHRREIYKNAESINNERNKMRNKFYSNELSR